MASPAEDAKGQCCLICGIKRMPRYKTDKSWSKHKEFCKGLTLKEAPSAWEGSSDAVLPKESPKPLASAIAKPEDLPRLLEDLSTQLHETEFLRVQLGVTLGEDGLSEERVQKVARGSDTGLAEERSTPEMDKAQIVEVLRVEFKKKYPHVEMVSQSPDLNILFDISRWQFLPPVPSAIFLYGRYRKMVRDIPQTRWPCMSCRNEKLGRYGKRKPYSGYDKPDSTSIDISSSCSTCKGSGLQYADSVQDLIGFELVEAFAAEDCVFHGMGREDIDVRCLGRGRPFVLELKAPKRRRPSQDLESLTSVVNVYCNGRVELLTSLQFSTRSEPARLKAAAGDKTYTIRFRVEGGFDRTTDELTILSLAGKALDQRTPSRVEHRRADIIRGRKIISLPKLVEYGDEVELTIKAESGTYIKEFVHGDDGRTIPSVASALGRKCHVIWLDVEEIHWD